MNKVLLFCCLFLFTYNCMNAQVSLTALNQNYTQDFTDYSGADGGEPANWNVITAAGKYQGQGTGSSNSGGVYSFGVSGSNERAVGGVRSGSAEIEISVSFTNNTGTAITALDISYNFEQYRYTNTSGWTVSQTNIGTSVNALAQNGTSSGTNGTVSSTPKSISLTGLNIANGTTFSLTWTANDFSGADNGIGIDDFSLTVTQILPVELSYFKGNKDNTNYNLYWQTQSEQNNSHFDIQRSTNSKTWNTIAKVEGAGTTDEVQDYTFTDKSPVAGMNYYRLMQVDYDGAFEYSSIVSVDMGKDEQVSVYPNPAADQVVFEFEKEQKEGTVLAIYNMNGQLLRTNILAEDALKVEMNVNDLVEGIYFMQITTNDGQIMSRFVKQ